MAARGEESFSPAVSPAATTNIDYALPYAGILPDHPLYYIKSWRDQILLWITRDPIKKSQLYLILADKQLVMGRQLLEKREITLSNDALILGEHHLLSSIVTLINQRGNRNELPPGYSDKIELSTKKHEEVLTDLISQATEQDQIRRIKEALSITHQAMQKATTLRALQ